MAWLGRVMGSKDRDEFLPSPLQGAPGAGLPGARGERGDPGPRVGTATASPASPFVSPPPGTGNPMVQPRGHSESAPHLSSGWGDTGGAPILDPFFPSLSSHRVKMGARGQKGIAVRR